MKIRFFVVLSVVFFCQAAALAATGTVRGEVTNGTKAGGSVEGLEVSLWTHPSSDTKPVATVKVDKDGKFEFANLTVKDRAAFEVRAHYGDVEFVSDPILVTAQKPTATAQVIVYDPSDREDRVVALVHHVRVLEIKNEMLHVGERMIVFNVGDPQTGGHVYMGKREGSRRKVLRLPLPRGAQNVEVKEEHGGGMMGGGGDATPLELVDDNYVEMSPLIPVSIEAVRDMSRLMQDPRKRVVAYSYDLKPTGGKYDLSRSLNYMTFTFMVMNKDASFNIKAPNLKEIGDQEINGQTWKVRIANEVPPDTHFEVTVAGRSFFSSEQGMAWMMAILVFGACVAGVIIGTRIRKGSEFVPKSESPPSATKSPRKATTKRTARQASLEGERESLIEEIALLDEHYEAGEISEKQYQRERTTKKNRLIELTKRLQKASSA
jgi:hypothetical protein